MLKEYQHFRNFSNNECSPLDGKKKKIGDILNKEILIINFQIKKSKLKDGNYTTIQFKSNEIEYVVFTGSTLLAEQLKQYKSKMPFFTTIIQKYKYYTMS